LRPHSTLRYYDQHKIEQDLQAGPTELSARKQWLGIA
jgi:hypothetical protein